MTQFLCAVNAYKAWIDSGKDYANFQHLFEDWDFECREYMKTTGFNRMQVISQIRSALGLIKL